MRLCSCCVYVCAMCGVPSVNCVLSVSTQRARPRTRPPPSPSALQVPVVLLRLNLARFATCVSRLGGEYRALTSETRSDNANVFRAPGSVGVDFLEGKCDARGGPTVFLGVSRGVIRESPLGEVLLIRGEVGG